MNSHAPSVRKIARALHLMRRLIFMHLTAVIRYWLLDLYSSVSRASALDVERWTLSVCFVSVLPIVIVIVAAFGPGIVRRFQTLSPVLRPLFSSPSLP